MAVFVILLALGAAVFGPHVFQGGFISDDWEIAAYERIRGYSGAVDYLWENLGSKPLLAILLPIPHALFGGTTELHLALAVVLGALTAALFYLVLRRLGLNPLHSVVIATLSLLLPWSDSIRLWPTASINNVAVCLYLSGLLLALYGLRHDGRKSVALHGGAVLLYVLSVLTYEIAGTAALVSGLLYLYVAPRARALRRWAADIAGVGAALAYTAATTVKNPASLDETLRHVGVLVRDAPSLLALAIVPIEDVPRAVGITLIVVVAAAGLVVLRRPRTPVDVKAELRRWLYIASAAVVALAACYAIVVPAPGLGPLSPGLLNRVNIVAALPVATFAYALVMVAAVLVVRTSSRWRRRSATVACLASALIAIGYVVKVADDEGDWARAWDEQEQTLQVIEDVLPDPPRGATVFTFGHRSEVAPRVPVFNETWDLVNALRLVWDDFELEAYPVFEGARFSCKARWMRPVVLRTPYRDLASSEPSAGAKVRYGKAVFVDVVGRTSEIIRDRAQCVSAVRGSSPGSFR